LLLGLTSGQLKRSAAAGFRQAKATIFVDGDSTQRDPTVWCDRLTDRSREVLTVSATNILPPLLVLDQFDVEYKTRVGQHWEICTQRWLSTIGVVNTAGLLDLEKEREWHQ